jgi:uncharacterized cupredoxin-like copper-binding protein
MRLPPPLMAAVGVLGLAVVTAIPLANGPATARAQTPVVQLVNVDEWSVNPRHIVVKANQPVRFVITNSGTTEDHDFAVAGMGMDPIASARVAPGGTVTLDAVFTAPGTYQTWCTRSGGRHKDAGMVGTLTVVPENQDAVLNVPVQLGEFFFNPMSLTAVAGQTTRFQLENVGTISHVFVVAGHGAEMRSPTVRVGAPVSWDVTFDEPGTYEVFCNFTVDDVLHSSMGMLGTLEVLPGGSGAGM